MAELRVPKLNNNDTEYMIVEWLVPDGAEVHEDDAVVLVETSKATEELPADTTGVLRHAMKAGAWCRPDEVIATIGLDAPVPTPTTVDVLPAPAVPSVGAPSGGDEVGGPLVTAPAQVLIDQHGITPEQVASLGVHLVRRADVERLLTQEDRRELPRVQRAVARAVELSHQTIPAAYVAVRMNLTPALERARALTREVRRPVGVAEIFVQAVAGLHGEFPLFFARLDGSHAVLSTTPDIGVTVDLGEGLYVPVVHDAAGRTLKDLAGTLMKHRLAATTGDFKEADLTGANFVVTLHTEGEVEMAIPFVFPGTAGALAVTSPADGTPALIGLAYDHRLINGRDASLFLAALRTAVTGWTGGTLA
ncbi:2-oxo acid dehydrogenase subunit E2 [Nonomuraea endophytica]|uniref:Dihydrolipoamide acetyltransferase component of pyruvate dehydrogenase complex n=1 Tax=Nonomuraea endophytica TaxID=714136 RepID=A0A7W8A698_9ACTN|nr:2-oxo acid dehydrogenase subunit E2 [Nonomuraea endophytica]MBB5080355.1 2-oxoglutarate dehydrogenase E2 component (dihydrolipoamide succinyltransferase) [Nonomuraea endophytica]